MGEWPVDVRPSPIAREVEAKPAPAGRRISLIGRRNRRSNVIDLERNGIEACRLSSVKSPKEIIGVLDIAHRNQHRRQSASARGGRCDSRGDALSGAPKSRARIIVRLKPNRRE